MEIHEIRRRNLWAMAHPTGYSDQGVKVLADKTGKTEQRIRHLIAKDPSSETFKNIGTKAAREFEKSLDLENAWLDHPHPELWEGTFSASLTSPAPPSQADPGESIGSLMSAASPNTYSALEKLQRAYGAGELTKDDLALLDAIARRLTSDKSSKNS